jgi:hypothetical protein
MACSANCAYKYIKNNVFSCIAHDKPHVCSIKHCRSKIDTPHGTICSITRRYFGPVVWEHMVRDEVDTSTEDMTREPVVKTSEETDKFIYTVTKLIPEHAEAYSAQLMHLYNTVFTSKIRVEEFVVSSLYLMMEGFPGVCEKNVYLSSVLPPPTRLCKIDLRMSDITSGKKKWRKRIVESSSIRIPTHESILQIHQTNINTHNSMVIYL